MRCIHTTSLYVTFLTSPSPLFVRVQGFRVTCEVTPHHLFLTRAELARLGATGQVKPPLMTEEDQRALWDNMAVIDCFATDHGTSGDRRSIRICL